MMDATLRRRLASGVNDPSLHPEHQLLIRRVAALQSRVTDLLRVHQAAQRALEAEIVRMRAQAVVNRTQRLWGLPEQPRQRREPSGTAVGTHAPGVRAEQAADSVLCQTGCVGHAHAWLQADGGCSRTSRACTEVPVSPTPPIRQQSDPDRARPTTFPAEQVLGR